MSELPVVCREAALQRWHPKVVPKRTQWTGWGNCSCSQSPPPVVFHSAMGRSSFLQGTELYKRQQMQLPFPTEMKNKHQHFFSSDFFPFFKMMLSLIPHTSWGRITEHSKKLFKKTNVLLDLEKKTPNQTNPTFPCRHLSWQYWIFPKINAGVTELDQANQWWAEQTSCPSLRQLQNPNQSQSRWWS